MLRSIRSCYHSVPLFEGMVVLHCIDYVCRSSYITSIQHSISHSNKSTVVCRIQWNLLNTDTFGTSHFVNRREHTSTFQGKMYWPYKKVPFWCINSVLCREVISITVCPSLRVSFCRGFTVSHIGTTTDNAYLLMSWNQVFCVWGYLVGTQALLSWAPTLSIW